MQYNEAPAYLMEQEPENPAIKPQVTKMLKAQRDRISGSAINNDKRLREAPII